MTCRNCSGVSRLAGTAVPMPALLTRMSMRPNSAIAAAAACRQSSGLATSVRTTSWRRPAFSTSAAVSASRAARRAASTTSAPASASACANTTPSPEDAPVTSATRPSSRKRSRMPMRTSKHDAAAAAARPRRPAAGNGGGPRHNAGMAERITGHPILIIGGGLAGGSAAATLREEGFRGPVVLIGREPGVPFGRPPLSKTYLRSEEDLTGWYVRPAGWYADHDVELRTGVTVAAVDPAAHAVTLDSGEELRYRKVLIATGGRNRRLAVPGAGLPGIHYLRTVAECDAIKRQAVPGRRAVVVGMGFIGCEVAASLRQLGGRATLETVLGGRVGALVAAVHRANGVELLAADRVAAFEGAERLEAVVTEAGRRIACDFAVAGIGIRPDIPRVAVARRNGILADELCRASAPDVYVAGDVANHRHPLFGRIRVEHFNNAEKQGAAAARAMLGSTARYDYLHSFWS